MEHDAMQFDRSNANDAEVKGGTELSSLQAESKIEKKDGNCPVMDVDKVLEERQISESSPTTLPAGMSLCSSPPIAASALWDPTIHRALNAATTIVDGDGGGDGNLRPKEKKKFSHSEVVASNAAMNGAPDGLLQRGMQFRTPVKANSSAHTDNTAMLEASLRHVLSDPVTGAFMDDAMVTRCGHSFCSASIKALYETGKCKICGASVPSDSLVPNFALRAAIQAFKREDHMWQSNSMKAGKRRREQSEQPEGSEGKRLARESLLAGEQTPPLESSRPRGVQFPFAVGDQVLIKGNKRTPERFVGREAIITSQCLNGWYLVRTLDNGESVRLQYRSLQKLGVDITDIEQHPESGSSPDEMGSVKKPASGAEAKVKPALSMSDDVLEGGTTDTRVTTAAYSVLPVKGMRTDSHKKPRKGDLTRSMAMAATSSTAGVSSSSSLDMQSDAKMTSPSGVAEETKVVDRVQEDDPYDLEPTASLSTVIEKAGGLVQKVEGSSGGGQLQERPQVWEGLIGHKDLPKPRGNGTEIVEVETITEVVPILESGDSFTVRSKRSALAARGPIASPAVESDPYRKVYASRAIRRGGPEGLISEPALVAGVESKPPERIVEGEGARPQWINYEPSSGEKVRQEAIQIPNMKEILSILRKDILNLEKEIPWSCLLKAWKLQRTNWRKAVKESISVEELGAKVKVFRSSLLLTMAGGMADEEWEKRLEVATKTDDVELLVSLWGRLYDDVYKWVQSKPKCVQEGITDTDLGDTFEQLRQQFPQLQVEGFSPVQITIEATLAAAEAVAEGHLDANVLLVVPTTLLQQHSREGLNAVREALEREKRHVVAKLAQLEANEAPKKKEDRVAGYMAGAPASGQVSMTSIPPARACSLQVDGANQKQQRRGNLDDGESDGVDDIRLADGEATDMSDSD